MSRRIALKDSEITKQEEGRLDISAASNSSLRLLYGCGCFSRKGSWESRLLSLLSNAIFWGMFGQTIKLSMDNVDELWKIWLGYDPHSDDMQAKKLRTHV